jgi:S1-C subfamily serine protease
MVVSCDQILTNQPAGGNLRLPAGSGFGCAAAIDPRGYFLTASHCLTRKEAYLIVYSSNMVRAVRARVVWQGKTKHEQPDVGILHIPLELTHTFAWAPDIATDEPVMAVGLAWTNRPDRELRGFALLAGRVLGHRESKRDIAYSCIENDIPLQSGDSGGPLVDLEGRLLGVNVRATPPLVHKVLSDRFFPTVAHRPNQAFLRQLIEEDVSSHFKWPDQYKGAR